MMQDWFKNAKLGIFIHWGIYSVKGIAESWSFGNGEYSYEEYMDQLSGFTAKKYDPKKWAELFKKAGANYAVLTAKHHDGVALFETQWSNLNVVEKTPAKRDLIGPYCEALRSEGLKVGIYFTNTDWSDIDHLSVILDKSPEEIEELRKHRTNIVDIWRDLVKKEAGLNNEAPLIVPSKIHEWERFMALYKGQIKELMTKYGDIDLMWFDVMLMRKGYDWDSENIKKMIEKINPTTVVNARLGDCGDYETTELCIPLIPLPGPWEMCTTFNDSWGYRCDDNHYKDIRQIVRMFVECISKGGNLLISAGPDAEGEIPKEYEDLMLKLGDWTRQYYEAIYPTVRGIGPEYFLGGSTLTGDRKTLYIFAYDCSSGRLMLNGIRNKINKITSLKTNNDLNYRIIGGADWVNLPGCIWIEVASCEVDEICTVIKIEFEGELDLVDINYEIQSKGEM